MMNIWNAFDGCINLTDITIPYSVTTIDYGAFYYCDNLNNITLSGGVASIGREAFSYTGYGYNESNWENGVLYIGNNLIKAKSSLSGEYRIKEGTRLIADNAFGDSLDLDGVIIPDSVTSIGISAFSGCANLANENIGKGVKVIGDSAFRNCQALNEISLSDNVTSIDVSAFAGCTNLSEINIPDSVTTIGANAFAGCTNLADITIGNGIRTIGSDTFSDTAYFNNRKNWDCSERDVNLALYIDKYLVDVKDITIDNNFKIKEDTLAIAEKAFYRCGK